MRMIIHPGLHKTGSTFLQHVFNDNADSLRARGVYYQKQPGYPAHHEAAWQILTGNAAPLLTMISEAEALGCDTVVLSSEDLEGALFDARPLSAIEMAASFAGISRVEWHVVLREPGAAFASLFAQLQHHVYADAFAMLYDAMRRGFLHVAAPMPGSGTPYWYYSFDHARDLARLADRAEGEVIAHDFAASAPFPGAGLLDHLGVLDAITALPGHDARNARPVRDDIIRGYVNRVAEAIPDDLAQRAILPGFLDALENGLDMIETYGAIVSSKYARSHREATQRFALANHPARTKFEA